MDLCNINDLINSLSMFHKLFDIVRIIDPVKKQVIHYDRKEKSSDRSICYDFWKIGEQCVNCVSARAMNENNTFVKIEYNDNRIYMIMASPVKLGNNEYVVEMLKDITETGIITDLSGTCIEEMNKVIAALNEKAMTDELTGLYNRRYINERLPVDIYNASINDTKLSVAMLDIDCFKDINDCYGHMVGDAVIKEVCQTMKSKVRKGHDWIARYGGEEFLITLIGADNEVAYKISENIRSALENKIIECHNHEIGVTASIGIYTIDPGTKSFDEVIVAVDENLYKAKNLGKNMTISS